MKLQRFCAGGVSTRYGVERKSRNKRCSSVFKVVIVCNCTIRVNHPQTSDGLEAVISLEEGQRPIAPGKERNLGNNVVMIIRPGMGRTGEFRMAYKVYSIG